MSIRQYSRVLFLVVVLSVLLLPAAYHRELVGHTLSKITTVTYSAARHSGWQPRNDLTRVLAHAPGFTVIENLYFQNETFIIVTPEPWSVPELKMVAQMKHHATLKGHKIAIKMLAVRGAAVGRVEEARLLGKTISETDAIHMAAEAIDLPSPMMINTDDNFVAHYYHWIGETFLGSWRVWKHWEWLWGVQLPQFKCIAFSNTWHSSELPHRDERPDMVNQWDDAAGANEFFLKTFFPDAEVETRTIWAERSESGKLYRIPLAVLGDRRSGHDGPGSVWKPWGDVLRLPVDKYYLNDLRDIVLDGYDGAFNIRKGPKPRLVYLDRQDTGRRLIDEDHKRLVRALTELQDDGLVDFEILQFKKGDSFTDQVAQISTIDFLVGVHGNGLTHSLWMTPGVGRAVFEIMPITCSINDYSPLALAAGVQHFAVRETELCTPLECPRRGCNDTRGPNRKDLEVTPKVITDEIRRLVHKFHNELTSE